MIGVADLGVDNEEVRFDRRVGEFVERDQSGEWHIPGVKVAYIDSSDPHQPVFRALTSGATYGLNSEAACKREHPHIPPDLDCTCGFYSFLHRNEVPELLTRLGRNTVLLNVALIGKVALFEGWGRFEGTIVRAQYQRILSWRTGFDGEDGGSLARLVKPRFPRTGSDWVSVPTPDWPDTDVPARVLALETVAERS